MRNLKITKILLSLMLMFGLTTSSFAAGGPGKGPKDNRPKIEKKVPGPAHRDIHKKEVKVVKVYKEPHHKPHHHHKHHDKVVYYSSNNELYAYDMSKNRMFIYSIDSIKEQKNPFISSVQP